MNIETASAIELTTFISTFINEKELDKSDFIVKHPFYGKTEMPFSVVKDALTTTEQNTDFLRQAAIAIHSLDINNASKEKFREFFQTASETLIKYV